MDTPRKVYRSTSDKMIGGVASGLGSYFGVDVGVARILWGLALFAGIGLPLYLLCWIAIPRERFFTVEEFTTTSRPRSGLFAMLAKLALVVCIGAIVGSNFDPDVAVAAFVIGLGFGLFQVWRNRSIDDSVEGERTERQSRFHRSETNRRILGVFGGLGETFDVDPTLLRIVGGIVLVAGFPVILPLYLLYAFVVPTRRLIAM